LRRSGLKGSKVTRHVPTRRIETNFFSPKDKLSAGYDKDTKKGTSDEKRGGEGRGQKASSDGSKRMYATEDT